jgi:predicted nucleic acid-binding protein
MGLTPARWLLDKSALTRLAQPVVNEALWLPILRGTVGVSICTELEMGFSARSADDYHETREKLVDRLVSVALPLQAENRAREVQAALVARGQHRAVSVPDLLIAATAEVEGLTVLHYDADFDLIAEITGQACEWVVPKGAI